MVENKIELMQFTIIVELWRGGYYWEWVESTHIIELQVDTAIE